MQNTSPSPTKKCFSPTGVVTTEYQFYLDPTPWNQATLVPLVQRGSFFALVAPSQTGKTTKAVALMELMQKTHQTILIDMSNVAAKRKVTNKPVEEIVKQMLQQKGFAFDKDMDLSDFFAHGHTVNQTMHQALFLVIDEIHAIEDLPDPTEGKSLLAILRSAKQNPGSWLKSLMLITNRIGSYLTATYGSSFPINDIVDAPYWTEEEVNALIAQFEAQEQVCVPPEIKNNIYSVTTGAHGATTTLCKLLQQWVEEHGKVPTLAEWLNNTSFSNPNFLRFLKKHSNFSIMADTLEVRTHWKALVKWFQAPTINFKPIVLETLKSANILREQKGELTIASPLVQRLVLSTITAKTVSMEVPTTQSGQIDTFALVTKTVKCMDIYRLFRSTKRRSNKSGNGGALGMNEPSYRNAFQLALCTAFDHAFAAVAPEKLVEGSRKALDHWISLYHNCQLQTLAIEHVTNASDVVLKSHVTDQGAIYHENLKPTLGTLVVNWTTSPDAETYKFYNQQGVEVLHVYHDEWFLSWKVVSATQSIEFYSELVNEDDIALEVEKPMQQMTLNTQETQKKFATFIRDAEVSGEPKASEERYEVALPELEQELHAELKELFELPATATIHILSRSGARVKGIKNFGPERTYFVRVMS